MLSRYSCIALVLFSCQLFSQDLTRYKPLKAEPVGGQEELEQILQTQLTLPKNQLSLNGHQPINAYFLIDSLGHAQKIKIIAENTSPILRAELSRVIKYLRFHKFDPDPQMPYQLSLIITPEKYKHYIKQKVKGPVKINMPADSSFAVHTRADKSPQFHKNGEEGLIEFLLNELEYPKVALDKSIEGTVIIDFIVETNGLVTGLGARQPVSAGCTEEAIRLIKQTKWQPAVLNNKLVRYKTSYPITFSLRNVNRNVGYSTQTLGAQN